MVGDVVWYVAELALISLDLASSLASVPNMGFLIRCLATLRDVEGGSSRLNGSCGSVCTRHAGGLLAVSSSGVGKGLLFVGDRA